MSSYWHMPNYAKFTSDHIINMVDCIFYQFYQLGPIEHIMASISCLYYES